MKLQILVGMIASGKTTYSKLAAMQGIICVNDDDIVNLVHGGNYTIYDKNLKLLYKSIENHIISQALGMGRTVLIDRGLNISRQGRERYIALAKSFDVPIEAIVMTKESPEIHAQRRFDSNSRGYAYKYWLDVAKIHDGIYERPTIKDFSSIHNISFNDIIEGKVV